MKQLLKKTSLILVTLFTLLSLVPKVGAAEIKVSELLGRAYESYTSLSSFHAHGTVKAAIDRQSQHMDLGEVEVDSYLDIANLNADLNLMIDSLFIPQFRHVRFGVKGLQAFYTIDDRYREITDVSQEKQSLQETIDEGRTHLPTPDDVIKTLAQYEALMQQIFDLKETDTEYVLSLKENIDVRKLFNDYKAELDAFKQALYNEMEARGEVVNASTKQQIERFYSAETLETFLASKPVYEVHFSKDRHLVTAVKEEVTLRFTDFLEVEEVEQLGLYTFYYSVDMTFDRFDEQQEIELPQISQSSDNSDMGSSEMSSESSSSASE